jgi:hypothetical protein
MNNISEKQLTKLDLDQIKGDNQEFIAYMQSLAERLLKKNPHAFDHNPLPK